MTTRDPPLRDAAAIIALTRQATASTGAQSIRNGKSSLELVVRAGELAATVPAGAVPAAQIIRASADRSMMRGIIHTQAAAETRARMTHAVADAQEPTAGNGGSGGGTQRYVKKSSLLNKVLTEGSATASSKRRKLGETTNNDNADENGPLAEETETPMMDIVEDAPTRMAQLERGERRCINRGRARDPRTHEITVSPDTSTRAVLDLDREVDNAAAAAVVDQPINPTLIQTREPLAEPSVASPARPYDGAIRSLKSYTEPIIDRDPLAALTRDVAFPLEHIRNPADQPENEDAVSGGYTPMLYRQIMRLRQGVGYEQRIRNALNSRKRLQTQQIPSEILHDFHLRSEVENAPDALIRQLAGPSLTTMQRERVSAEQDPADSLFLGHRMYAHLPDADQEEVRRTYNGLDSLVRERMSIDELSHLFLIGFVTDGVAVSEILPSSVKERYAEYIRQHAGSEEMEYVDKLLGRAPTYRHGLDIHAAAERAERMAFNNNSAAAPPGQQQQTAAADARRAKEAVAAAATASALQKIKSCITSALMDDMKRNTPGVRELLMSPTTSPPDSLRASFITRTSAAHVASIGAAMPTYSVCELTYGTFASILETIIVDPQEGVPAFPLCKNGIHCECNRLVARHDGTVSPDGAPSAPACNGHAPIAVGVSPAEAGNDDAQIIGKSEMKRFIGRAFYPPGTPVYKSASDPRPCLLCHWKDVNATYHRVGVDQLSIKTGEEGYTPPPNMFTVTVDCPDGFQSDKCLPRIVNGRPSGITGNVPIYHPDCVAYRRVSVPNPLKPGQESKVHRVVIVGMDFRPSSPK